MKYDELTEMDCKVATLSVDPVKSHNEWLRDVVAHCENEIEVNFPIIGTYSAEKKILRKWPANYVLLGARCLLLAQNIIRLSHNVLFLNKKKQKICLSLGIDQVMPIGPSRLHMG